MYSYQNDRTRKKESIYFLTMDAGENRWNTTFVREFANALDQVEKDDGPGALVTTSNDQNFSQMALTLTGFNHRIIFQKKEIEKFLVKSSCF